MSSAPFPVSDSFPLLLDIRGDTLVVQSHPGHSEGALLRAALPLTVSLHTEWDICAALFVPGT